MSIGRSGLGIPAVILQDAEGFMVTVETKTGEIYKGILTERSVFSIFCSDSRVILGQYKQGKVWWLTKGCE